MAAESKEVLTIDAELAYKILEHEGLCYAILDYFGPDQAFANAEFTQNWRMAAVHIKVIRDFLIRAIELEEDAQQ